MKYAVFASPIGPLLLAHSGKGVCMLHMLDEASDVAPLVTRLEKNYKTKAEENSEFLQSYIRATLAFLDGRHRVLEFPLDIAGTPFQQAVWQALRGIPYGQTRSYKEIAAAAGNPRAVRAVGGACGANPVVLAVPCHRVIETSGGMGGFANKRHAVDKKRWLLELEQTEASSRKAA